MSAGGGHPGKFPAKIVVVAEGLVTLDAKPEDVEYLAPFVGQVVTVEITPGHSPGGKRRSGAQEGDGPS